jgi:hypothetical protein
VTAIPAGLTGYGLADVEWSTTAGGVPLLSAALPAAEHDPIWRALRGDHPRTG